MGDSVPCDKEVRFRTIDSRNGPTNVAALNFGAGRAFGPTRVWASVDTDSNPVTVHNRRRRTRRLRPHGGG
jgi:hypothetical protein